MGVKPVNLPAPVKYFTAEEGGVSHFNYLRDNALLTWMHTRLFFGFLLRLPLLRGAQDQGRRETEQAALCPRIDSQLRTPRSEHSAVESK